MGEVSKAEIAKLVLTITKAKENMPDDFDGKLKAKLLELNTTVEDLNEEKLTKNNYDKLLAASQKSLKEVVEANKAEKKGGDEKKEWTISGYDDKGHCADAAKNAIPGLETAYKKKLNDLLVHKINEGHLGVLYEKNLTTSGDKYSLFFKYVRTTKDHEARLVGVAIGCHNGSGYVEVNKDGKATKTKISAQKKNL